MVRNEDVDDGLVVGMGGGSKTVLLFLDIKWVAIVLPTEYNFSLTFHDPPSRSFDTAPATEEGPGRKLCRVSAGKGCCYE